MVRLCTAGDIPSELLWVAVTCDRYMLDSPNSAGVCEGLIA